MTTGDFVLSEIPVLPTRVRLHHVVIRPTSTVWSRLLVVHGYGEHCGRYLSFMRHMADCGVACEAIDFRGHGRSTGRRGDIQRWEEYLDDLAAFLGTHKRTADPSTPLFMFGHSHGGLILAAAGERGLLREAGVAGCALGSPYFKTLMPVPAIKRFLAHAVHHVLPWLQIPTGMKGQWLTSNPESVAEDRDDPLNHHIATPRWYVTRKAAQAQVMANAAQFRLPVLCLAGDADIVSNPGATAEFFRNAGSSDKSLYVYPGGKHELLHDLCGETVFTDILGWMQSRGVSAECRVQSENK